MQIVQDVTPPEFGRLLGKKLVLSRPYFCSPAKKKTAGESTIKLSSMNRAKASFLLFQMGCKQRNDKKIADVTLSRPRCCV